MVFAPLWGLVAFSTPAALVLMPSIMVGIFVASVYEYPMNVRIGMGGVAAIYLVAWSVDIIDRRHHHDAVDALGAFIADALPDGDTGYHPEYLSAEQITGVLALRSGHHDVVAVCTGTPNQCMDLRELRELDGTRRAATRRGRRTVGLQAAEVASLLHRPLLGWYQ